MCSRAPATTPWTTDQVHLETRLVGDRVSTLPYKAWKPQRRPLQPVFTKQHVATFAG